MNRLEESAPGKINLTLSVLDKLDSGLHQLESIICPITLADNVSLEITAGRGEVTCKTSFSSALSNHLEYLTKNEPDTINIIQALSSEANLAAKAGKKFLESFPIGARCNLSIYINKDVPFGAGLGGGSSNAAAVLRMLANHFSVSLRAPHLINLAGSIGSDVPALIEPGIKLIGHTGSLVKKLAPRTKNLSALKLLIAKPPFSVSTTKAYSWLTRSRSPGAHHFISPKTRSALECLALDIEVISEESDNKLTLSTREGISEEQKKPPFDKIFFNDFEEVVIPRFKELGVAKGVFESLGAGASILAGSGSALVGFFETWEKAELAEKRMLREFGPAWLIAKAELKP